MPIMNSRIVSLSLFPLRRAGIMPPNLPVLPPMQPMPLNPSVLPPMLRMTPILPMPPPMQPLIPNVIPAQYEYG